MAAAALSIKLRCASWQQLSTIYKRDLSRGSMFLKASTPPALGTSVHDGELAERAADLGVVGFVHKPLVDIDEIVERLAQLENESLLRTREHLYIQRIKARHERVLAKYRSLPREP